MKAEEFNYVVKNQIDRCNDILSKKSNSYATNSDKLHNFRQAAHLSQESMRHALAGMMMKHTISLYDMLYTEDIFLTEVWDEKITDHINYLLILKAIIEDEALARKGLEDPQLSFDDNIKYFNTPTEPVKDTINA